MSRTSARVPLDAAIGMVMPAQSQQLHEFARTLEQAWSDGRLHVWRNDRLMRPHEMLGWCVCVEFDLDRDIVSCSIQPRPGTLASVGTNPRTEYRQDGAVLVYTPWRWEFDRADVEELLLPPDRKRAQRALLRAIVEVCPDYEDMGTTAVVKLVGDRLTDQGKPVPSRERFERAMGRRK